LIFFFAGAVFRWIICGGVSTHAISVGFHKNRAFAATSMVYGVIHNGCGSKWIITIHSKPFKPVALCAFIYRHLGLNLERRGDGPVVILNKEHDRCIK